MKVREKRAKLKESEAELARRHEATRRALEAQARELEERQRALQAERAAWERDTGLSLDDLRRRSLEANSKEWVSTVVASSRLLRGRRARLLSSAVSNPMSGRCSSSTARNIEPAGRNPGPGGPAPCLYYEMYETSREVSGTS